MLNIEWDQLYVKKDWANALDQLLAEARVSGIENQAERLFVCQEDLLKFIELAPTDAEDLKLIAKDAIKNLQYIQVSDDLKAIDQYLLALQDPAIQLEGITTAMDQEKSRLFTKTIEILNQASSSIDVLVKMEKQLTEPNQDLILRIDAVSRSIQELFVLAEELKNARESTD
jgi:hypothetical protein